MILPRGGLGLETRIFKTTRRLYPLGDTTYGPATTRDDPYADAIRNLLNNNNNNNHAHGASSLQRGGMIRGPKYVGYSTLTPSTKHLSPTKTSQTTKITTTTMKTTVPRVVWEKGKPQPTRSLKGVSNPSGLRLLYPPTYRHNMQHHPSHRHPNL